MNSMINPFDFIDGFLKESFDFDSSSMIRLHFKKDVDFDEETYLVKRPKNWMTLEEYFSIFIREQADRSYNQLLELINYQPGLKAHYFDQFPHILKELKEYNTFNRQTVEFQVVKIYLDLADRFKYKIGLEHVDMDFILFEIRALISELNRYKLMNFTAWYDKRGEIEKPQHLFRLLPEGIDKKKIFDSQDVFNAYLSVVTETCQNLRQKIDNYLVNIEERGKKQFILSLTKELENLIDQIDPKQSFFHKTLCENINQILTKKDTILWRVNSNSGKKKKKIKPSVKGFEWIGSKEEISLLYNKIHGKLIDCELDSLLTAFSGEVINKNLRVKWILRTLKSDDPEVTSIFYFLMKLSDKKKLKTEYNFHGKNSRQASSTLYEQISMIFIKANGEKIDRETIRNRKPKKYHSENFKLINDLIKSVF